MSNASTPFKRAQAALPLPMNDKRLVRWETLKEYLPESRFFTTARPLEREAMIDIIQHGYNGKPTLSFIDALKTVSEAIEYVTHYKYNHDFMQNIDLRLLGGNILAEAPTIAFTMICQVAEAPPKKEAATPSGP